MHRLNVAKECLTKNIFFTVHCNDKTTYCESEEKT